MDPRRIAAIAAVAVIHAGAFILIARPGAPTLPRRWPVRPGPVDALRVRLITAPAAALAVQMPGPPHLRMPKHRARRAAVRPAYLRAHASSHSMAGRQRVLSLKLPSGWVGQHRKHGGWAIARSVAAHRHNVPLLPGSAEPVHGSPVFAMADPRTQGVAGVVRIIQGLFGYVDPHCLDVEKWRTMSPEELGKHYVTLDQIDKSAEQYGCDRAKRGGLLTTPFGH